MGVITIVGLAGEFQPLSVLNGNKEGIGELIARQ